MSFHGGVVFGGYGGIRRCGVVIRYHCLGTNSA